jgi:hypothetical protein
VSALLQMLGRMSSANQSSFVTDPNLLQILSQLWLFASETICKQSVEISAKILSQCRAEDFTKFMTEFVENMLVLVAKAISIQLKEKSGIGKIQRKMEKLSISVNCKYLITKFNFYFPDTSSRSTCTLVFGRTSNIQFRGCSTLHTDSSSKNWSFPSPNANCRCIPFASFVHSFA